MDRRVDREIESRRKGRRAFVRQRAQGQRNGRQPEFEFGRLRVPDEATHRLLLKAGEGGTY